MTVDPLTSATALRDASDGRPTALFVSSSGGVLLDLLALDAHFDSFAVRWAVVKADDTLSALRDRPVHWVRDISLKHPWNMARGFREAHRLLRDVRPALIVSAGSGPAFPFFVTAKAMGIATFWISTLNIHDREGLTARLCAAFASRIFVQQASLARSSRRAIFIGELY